MRGDTSVVALAGAGSTPAAPILSILANSAASNAAICLFDSTITLIVVLLFVVDNARLLSAISMLGMSAGGPGVVTELALPKITALPHHKSSYG